jgi:hypothetical protein
VGRKEERNRGMEENMGRKEKGRKIGEGKRGERREGEGR